MEAALKTTPLSLPGHVSASFEQSPFASCFKILLCFGSLVMQRKAYFDASFARFKRGGDEATGARVTLA